MLVSTILFYLKLLSSCTILWRDYVLFIYFNRIIGKYAYDLLEVYESEEAVYNNNNNINRIIGKYAYDLLEVYESEEAVYNNNNNINRFVWG